MNTKQYVCSGDCKGVSETPGVCMTESCPKHGQPLVECDCTDGTHPGIAKACLNCGKICKLSGGCDMEEFKPELTA